MIGFSQNKALRYEKKYLITVQQAEQIKLRMDTLCYRDGNVKAGNRYNIRSLYFDDYFGSSYQDNQIGIEPRSKYRVRIYDCNNEFISLEQKNKIAEKICKERANISEEMFEAMLRDEVEKIEYPNESPLVNKFIAAWYTRNLRPTVIVDYDREPYIYPDGDVRITFDTNISFSGEIDKFFDKKIFQQPILSAGMQLLEVKYTEFMPEFIHQQINDFNLQQCTFSKYYLCEKFRRMGEY